MTRRLALISSFLAALALGGCLGNSGSAQPAPTGVQLYAGDAAVSVVWNDDPLINYWLFYAQDPTVSPLAISQETSMLNVGVVEPAFSPVILCNGARLVVNNYPATDPSFPAIYVTINGRTGTAKGGPGSAPVSALPRAAGGPNVPWVSGASIPARINAMGYVPLSTCGYAGGPPEGIFVAVGPSATVYASTLAPAVAGPLTNPGNVTMAWTQGNVPLGFNENLNAVGGRSTGAPSAPNLLFAAVGDNGAILHSYDGQNWSRSNNVPTSVNLHDVTYAASAFVAIGDDGVVLTSADAVTWTVNQSAQLANPSATALRAIHCVASSCLIVGDAGTTMWSSTGGANWTLMTHGANNWIAAAYGNADANRDAVVSHPNGSVTITTSNEAIGTWVIVDALGNYAYFNGSTASAWADGATTIAPGIVAIDYTSNFIALDKAGNAWLSENGSTDAWATYGAAPVAANGASAVALHSNGQGFVAMGSAGANAANF